MNELLDGLTEAILQRRVVAFTYHRHHRVVVPGALGPHITTRNLELRGYQIDGSSGSGLLPDWRFFRLDQITDLMTTDILITAPPPDFNPLGDAHLHPIIAKLEF